jgi:hypothetical protein
MSSHGPGQAGCTWLALGFSKLLIFGEKGWVEISGNWRRPATALNVSWEATNSAVHLGRTEYDRRS